MRRPSPHGLSPKRSQASTWDRFFCVLEFCNAGELAQIMGRGADLVTGRYVRDLVISEWGSLLHHAERASRPFFAATSTWTITGTSSINLTSSDAHDYKVVIYCC